MNDVPAVGGAVARMPVPSHEAPCLSLSASAALREDWMMAESCGPSRTDAKPARLTKRAGYAECPGSLESLSCRGVRCTVGRRETLSNKTA